MEYPVGFQLQGCDFIVGDKCVRNGVACPRWDRHLTNDCTAYWVVRIVKAYAGNCRGKKDKGESPKEDR